MNRVIRAPEGLDEYIEAKEREGSERDQQRLISMARGTRNNLLNLTSPEEREMGIFGHKTKDIIKGERGIDGDRWGDLKSMWLTLGYTDQSYDREGWYIGDDGAVGSALAKSLRSSLGGLRRILNDIKTVLEFAPDKYKEVAERFETEFGMSLEEVIDGELPKDIDGLQKKVQRKLLESGE